MVDVVSYNSLINGFCRSSVEGHGDMLGCLLNVHTLDAVVSSFCDSGGAASYMDVPRER